LKTSSTSDYFGIKFSVQLAEYAHGTPFDVEKYARTSWSTLIGIDENRGVAVTGPHPQWGLIIHIPTGNPNGAGLHWVDVEAGRELSELALTVRRQRNRKDLVVPAKPPLVAETMTPARLMAAILGCQTKAQIDELFYAHRAIWDQPEEYKRGPHTRAGRKRLDEIAQLEKTLAKAGS